MSLFDDASGALSSFFSTFPVAPAPLPQETLAPATYVGPGGGSATSAAAAFSHYAEEAPAEPLPTGLMSDEEIERAYLESSAASADTLPMGDLSEEELERLRAQLPTGLSTDEEIDRAYADSTGSDVIERSMRRATDDEIERVRAAYEGATLPTGLYTDEEIERAYADAVDGSLPRSVPPGSSGPAASPHRQELPPTGLLTEEELDRAYPDSKEAKDPDARPMTEEARLLEVMSTGDPAAAAAASVELMSLKLAQVKATELAAVATQEEGVLSAIGIDDRKDRMEATLEGLSPELREKTLAHLDSMTALPAGALDDAREASADITESEQRAADRAMKIDGAVDAAEAAAKSGKPGAMAANLDKLTPKQRDEAMEKMSPEARATAEEALDKRRAKLELIAERLENAQHGTGATDATDEVSVVTNLSGLTESEAEELQEIYGDKFKDDDGQPRSLTADLHDEFDEDDKEYALISAVMNGDVEEADALSVELTVSYLEDEAEAWVNADESVMNDLLRAHSGNPEAMRAIAEAYEEKTGKDLSAACEDVMDQVELKEAHANIEGDLRTANVAVLEQGDDDRTRRVVEDAELDDGGIEQLARDTQKHTGRRLNEVVEGKLDEDTAERVDSRIEAEQKAIESKRNKHLKEELDKLTPEQREQAEKKAESVAGQLSTQLSKMHLAGNNTEVTDLLRGLEPGEVLLVMQHYEKMSISGDASLEADLRANLDGKDLKVANAALTGDKVLTAVALVEQAADNRGTNVEGWKKAMETLTSPEDRQRFRELMNTHVGGSDDAYEQLVISETSSFERDELLAQGIVDEDERAGTLAQVAVSKAAYGGKFASMVESVEDEVHDAIGEDEDARAARRQQTRRTWLVQASNWGTDDDGALDAMGRLENAEQARIFREKMKGANGETAAETIDEELSGHHEAAALEYAEGDYEGGQAERMVGELDDNYIDDREDAASMPFEQVRVDPKTLAQIKKLPPEEREAKLEEEKKKLRESLLEKADIAAQKAGHDSYLDMLKGELSPVEYQVALDRIELGKVRDVTALFKAGGESLGGAGKDPKVFREIMKDKTPAEMEKLRGDFEAEHPGVEFDEWVLSKTTSAGERRDFAIMLEGNYARMPKEELAELAHDNPSKLIERVKALGEAARGGADGADEYDPVKMLGNAAGNALGDTIGNAGERLDHRLDEVAKLEAKLQETGSLTPDEEDQLIAHMRYMAGDQEAFTETKSSAVNAGAEAVGTVVELSASAAGAGPAAQVVAGVVKMGIKSTFDPARYSTDAKIGDTVQIVADAAGEALGKRVDIPIVSEAIEGAVSGLGTALGDTQNWTDLGKLIAAAGTQAVHGGVSGAAGAIIEETLGDNDAASALLGALVEHALTGDTSQTFGDQALEIFKSAAIDYAKNMAEGHGERRRLEEHGPDAVRHGRDSDETSHMKPSPDFDTTNTADDDEAPTPRRDEPSSETQPSPTWPRRRDEDDEPPTRRREEPSTPSDEMPTPRRDEPASETQPSPTWPRRRDEDDEPPTRRREEPSTPSDETPTPRRDEPPSETQPLPTWPLRRHEDDDGPPTRPYEPSTPSDAMPTPRREELPSETSTWPRRRDEDDEPPTRREEERSTPSDEMPTPRREENAPETLPSHTWPHRRDEDDDGRPTLPYEPSTPSEALPTQRREENAPETLPSRTWPRAGTQGGEPPTVELPVGSDDAPTAERAHQTLAEHEHGDGDSEGDCREQDVADHERRGDEHTEPVGDRRVDVPRTIADLEHVVLAPDHVDSEALAEAKQRLADNQPLTRADMNAVLHLAVEAARNGIEAEYGEGLFAQREVSGACGPVQQGITDLLAHILGPEANIQMHASHPNEVDGASIEGSKLQGDVRHYFTTIMAPDGRMYLVDPTFVQFTTGDGTVAQRLLDHGGGAAAQQLVQQGFVELTPDVANAYGRALTNKEEEFTPQDFVTGNRAPDKYKDAAHGGNWSGKMIDASEEAKRRWDEATSRT